MTVPGLVDLIVVAVVTLLFLSGRFGGPKRAYYVGR